MARYNKFWVALLTALGVFVSTMTGEDIGLSPEVANAIVALVGAGLVWLVPNRQ